MLLQVHLADDLVVAGPAEGLPIVVARQLVVLARSVLVTRLPTSPLQRPTSLWRRCVGATLLFTTLPPTPTGFPLAGGEEARPPLRLLPMLLVRQEEGRALRGDWRDRLELLQRAAPHCRRVAPPRVARRPAGGSGEADAGRAANVRSPRRVSINTRTRGTHPPLAAVAGRSRTSGWAASAPSAPRRPRCGCSARRRGRRPTRRSTPPWLLAGRWRGR